MTTPFWCLLIVTFLPFLWSIVGNVLRQRQFGRIDNNHPRQQQAQLTGAGARALAAQQNAWEALAMFTPAVLIAHFNGATAGQAATAAMLFVAMRVVHGVFYLTDLSTLRSISWVVAFGALIWLFVIAV